LWLRLGLRRAFRLLDAGLGLRLGTGVRFGIGLRFGL
jgi:hypothetical protein